MLTGIVDFIPIWEIYEGLIPMGLGLGVGIGLLGSFFTYKKASESIIKKVTQK